MSTVKELTFTFLDQELILSVEKAIYWANKEALIVSDLHLGKAGHFRKSGIAIPKKVDDQNLTRLNLLIDLYSPRQILFLGDLFHSQKNSEWNSFIQWKNQHQSIKMHLAIGNHDFHPPEEYQDMGLTTSYEISVAPFLLMHEAFTNRNSQGLYPISGHVHPSVRFIGKGRQAKRIPCFYFGSNGALLPAFGNFTGTHTIKPKVDEFVFGIIEDQIMQIS